MTLSRGTCLGPYEIVALIGAGAMGEVYRARDPRLRRDVAIKILPPAFTGDPERLYRFRQEACTTGGLNHPNILAVYDFGMHERSPYLVTELLGGETLRERLARGPLPPRRAVEFAIQLAHGLSAAHQKGIVHRDLKPENIFLTQDGHVKILDFGLAKTTRLKEAAVVTSASTLVAETEPGTILGTVGYMSPEQVRGLPADERSDIFSFGVILFEMLTGQRAFRGESSVETMNAILKDDLPDVCTPERPIPPAVDRVVEHCTEKNPDERFQSAHDLSFALEALSGLTDQGLEAAPARWRKPLVQASHALLLSALVAGVIIGSTLTRWLSPAPPSEPPTFKTLTYSGHDYSPAASADGRVIAFTSDRDGRPRIWLKQLAGGDERPLTAGPDDFARISPDGSMVLYTHTEDGRTSLYRVPLLGGEPRRIIEDAAEGDWSPDGAEIAFVRWKMSKGKMDSGIGLVGAGGAGEREIAQFPDKKLARVRWSPDGKLIAAIELVPSGALHPIFLVSAGGNEKRSILPPRAGFAISSPAWLRSGEELVYFQNESALEGGLGTNAGTANLVRQNIRTGVAQTVAWSSESGVVLDIAGSGRLVYDTCSPRASLREIRLAGAPAAQPNRWLTRSNANDRQPAYSPDGEWVIFSSNRSGNLDLWKISTRTEVVRRLTDDPSEDWDPVFTRDGKRIFWSSNRTGHFEIWTADAEGSGARQLTSDGVDAENPTVTPDGAWVLYASTHPEKAGLWKIRADGSAATRLVAGNFALPELSPDGRYALYSVNYLTERVSLRVAAVADGAEVPFEIKLGVQIGKQGVALGRARWMPDGRAITFIGQSERGVTGIFVQDFAPGKDASATRRPLGGFDPELTTESFGISPDGSRLTIASWEQLFSLMVAERLPGILPPVHSPRAP